MVVFNVNGVLMRNKLTFSIHMTNKTYGVWCVQGIKNRTPVNIFKNCSN